MVIDRRKNDESLLSACYREKDSLCTGSREKKKKKEKRRNERFFAALESSKLAAISEIGKRSSHVPFDTKPRRLDSVSSSTGMNRELESRRL